MNQDETQAREQMVQRLREEETQMRLQMQRHQEEQQARLEMQKRLHEEEMQIRAQRNVQVPPAATQPVIINNVINNNNNVNLRRPTLGIVVRVLYFAFIGWWFGWVWLFGAVLMCISFFGLPIGILMFAKTADAFFLW